MSREQGEAKLGYFQMHRVCPFGYELFSLLYIDSLFSAKLLFALALALKLVEISEIRGRFALFLFWSTN